MNFQLNQEMTKNHNIVNDTWEFDFLTRSKVNKL